MEDHAYKNQLQHWYANYMHEIQYPKHQRKSIRTKLVCLQHFPSLSQLHGFLIVSKLLPIPKSPRHPRIFIKNFPMKKDLESRDKRVTVVFWSSRSKSCSGERPMSVASSMNSCQGLRPARWALIKVSSLIASAKILPVRSRNFSSYHNLKFVVIEREKEK
jgi:hypothetical protein